MKTLPSPEHRVAREADPPEQEAHAVRRVTGRRHRRERPDRLPVAGSATGTPNSLGRLRMIGMRVRKNHPLNAVVSGPAQSVEVRRDRRAPDRPPSRDTTYEFVPSSVSADGFGARTRTTPSGTGTPRFLPEYSRPSWARTPITGDAAWSRRAFPLALAAMAVVVIVDLSVDTYALLIQLLLVGPLIAATGATARQTRDRRRSWPSWSRCRIVAATHDDAFSAAATRGHRRARHRRRHGGVHRPPARASSSATPRASRRSTASRARSPDAHSFDEAAPDLLESIARPLGRQVAHFWSIGDDDRLRCVAQWREEGVRRRRVRARHSRARPRARRGPARRGVGDRPAVLARRRDSPRAPSCERGGRGGGAPRRHGVPRHGGRGMRRA